MSITLALILISIIPGVLGVYYRNTGEKEKQEAADAVAYTLLAIVAVLWIFF